MENFAQVGQSKDLLDAYGISSQEAGIHTKCRISWSGVRLSPLFM
jgi:hypothetical protein